MVSDWIWHILWDRYRVERILVDPITASVNTISSGDTMAILPLTVVEPSEIASWPGNFDSHRFGSSEGLGTTQVSLQELWAQACEAK